jgi:hypothetical protein
MCPEERDHIIEKGLISCNAVLEELSKRTADVLIQMSHEELQLADSVQPQACAAIIAVAYQQQPSSSSSKHQQQSPVNDVKMPGHESMRSARDGVSNTEKNYMYLVELCQVRKQYQTILTRNQLT